MAKLGPYFGLHTGQLKIYISQAPVGQGTFPSFTDFQMEFDGTYSVLFFSGTINLKLNLTDQNPANTSGPCSIVVNGRTDDAATYTVNGQKLTVTTTLNSTPIEIYASQGGTQINNVSGHNAWLGP